MKKRFYSLLTIIILILFSSISFSQLNDYSYKIGVQGSYLLPKTFFKNDNLSLLFRPFIRFEMGRFFDLGFGIGYGWLGMKDLSNNPVKTTIVPFDGRLLFSPIVNDAWNPYLYGGFGGVFWENINRPINPEPSTDIKKYTDVFIPIGGGVEIALSKNLLLDIHVGWNYSWTELMTGYNDPNKDPDVNSFVNDSWWNFGLGLAYSKESCSKDSDEDGITDCDEEKLGLDPFNNDTDEDRLEDGVELDRHNTDPKNADSDGDQLMDGDEILTYSTNPLSSDSDNDGLDDFVEINTFKSDPNNSDSDLDGISDGDEVNKYGTNPNKSDSDGDTIDDPTEINKTKTDPTKIDTDNDGLKDPQEINIFHTDPNNPDTDGDKLSDSDEVISYNTNPNEIDTDKGGLDDFLEIQLNKNPSDPRDDIASIDLEIAFGFNSSVLSEEAIIKLYRVLPKAKEIVKSTKAMIEIQGHSDNVGSKSGNQKISEARAKAVYDWLLQNGIDPSRLRFKGYGDTQPKYSNRTQEGRDKNRRIEFYVDRETQIN